jgi:hypothetical protein
LFSARESLAGEKPCRAAGAIARMSCRRPVPVSPVLYALAISFVALMGLAMPVAAFDAGGQASAQASECAAGWELDGQLCYPACPAGFTAAGPLCREQCPPGHVDEGDTCRLGPDVTEKRSRPRDGAHLTRTAYRELFVNFVQLYRAGAAVFASPLTEEEKSFLRRFFPERLVGGLRVVMIPAIELPFGVDAIAMTIGPDLVVVEQGQRSEAVLKHELVHVCQADRVGLGQFIRGYADQFVDSGYDYRGIAFEREAYAFADLDEPISRHLGYCE